MDNELEDTAYHEAGHAVAHWRFKHVIRYVTIEPGRDGSLGHCKSVPRPVHPGPKTAQAFKVCLATTEAQYRGEAGIDESQQALSEYEAAERQEKDEAKSRRKQEEEVIALLAGGAAEIRASDQWDIDSFGADLDKALDRVDDMASSNNEAESLVEDLFKRTWDLVVENWDIVSAVATELLKSSRLFGDDVNRIASACAGDARSAPTGAKGHAALKARLKSALREGGAMLPDHELARLAHELHGSIRAREEVKRVRVETERLSNDGILYLIHEASAGGDRDEAIWRAFLAVHFGQAYTACQYAWQPDGAAWLLYGAGSTPVWTWATASRTPQALRDWLLSQRGELVNLRFGNHRKYQSKQPEGLWRVLEAFLTFVARHGGSPTAALDQGWSPRLTRGERFRSLYKRFRGLHQFGRTGAFDFAMLLADLGLIDAEPESCYLTGSTGPVEGARRIWSGRTNSELEGLAASLARRLNMSPAVVEDTLCNWQKRVGPQRR